MLRFALSLPLSLAFCTLALPAVAETEKEISCRHQAEVVAAVRQARLDRVNERKVQARVLEGDPVWPEKYNAIIPIVTPWIYELSRKDVRDNDLAQVWNEGCLAR
jgi:hypothetical protein